MNITKINELLTGKDQSNTREIILIPNLEDDSDIVYELDYKDKFKLFRKKHEIFDSHEGWVVLTCHKSKKRFFHNIQVPNKLALVCRACKQEV